MADIDDFFAKKDKKKKGTKKFAKANTDVIAKNLIETDKKELRELEKQEKELAPQLSEDSKITPQASQDDEEWEEYRENKKDFSGLKIETLTIQEPQLEEEEEETEINEDGEVVKVKKDESGPWKVAKDHEQQESGQDPEPAPQPSGPSSTPSSGGGAYKAPHLRNSSSSAAATPVRPMGGSRRNKNAPDISSEVNFPSLSMAAEDANLKTRSGGSLRDDGGKFEEVRERGGQSYARQAEAPRIALGNRYSSLVDGD